MNKLPQKVVEEDQSLNGSMERRLEKLAKLRWHWTLDESNPERVNVNQYAQQVGRAHTMIQMYVKGYVLWDRRASAASLSECMERANMSVETEAAVEAVATARGLNFKTARQKRLPEAKEVREEARERAEGKGTSVADEVGEVAKAIVRGEDAGRREDDDKRSRIDPRLIEIMGHLSSARNRLRKALKVVQGIDWTEEYREIIREDADQVREVVNMIEAGTQGTKPVDWDSELHEIVGKGL